MAQYEVSIPYGTIKSTENLEEWENLTVSIPYGTIKRGLLGLLGGAVSRFQFLMVQLKAGAAQGVTALQPSFNSLWYN